MKPNSYEHLPLFFFDRTNTTLAALARCTHLQKRIAAHMINLFRISFQSVFPYVNSRKNCLCHLWRCGSEHLPIFSLRVFPYSCMLRMFFLPALANTGTVPATDAASRHWAIKSSLPFCQRLNIIRAYMLARLECWGLSTNEEKNKNIRLSHASRLLFIDSAGLKTWSRSGTFI